MARVKLALPERFIFETDIKLRISDINYGGHLGNDAVLSIVHETRIRFLKEHNWTELNVCGAGMIQSDAVIVYKSQAFHGETVNVQLALCDFTSTGCDFLFLLSGRESGKEIARAKTGIVFFDYDRNRPLKVPEDFLKLSD